MNTSTEKVKLSINTKLQKEDSTKELPSRKTFSMEHFQILKTLGHGSFGIVKLVRDKRNNEFYALKCLQKQAIHGKQVQHIINERDILRRFEDGDFCCKMFESLQDKQQIYMVLEYLSGGELIKN